MTPVPGTLRKQFINEEDIARTLEREFQLPSIESRTYIRLVTSEAGFDQVAKELGVTDETGTTALGEDMVRKGLLIRASTGEKNEFIPLHPRMVLSNVFKMFEKNLVQSLRDRRATVDRVVNLLTPFYEEKTNSTN
jgi:hypothetical protein